MGTVRSSCLLIVVTIFQRKLYYLRPFCGRVADRHLLVWLGQTADAVYRGCPSCTSFHACVYQTFRV
jgi:hypothetical protein